MTYRTILLQMLEDEATPERNATAVALAARFSAHLIGMHVAPPPVMPFGYGEAAAYVGPEVMEAQRQANAAVGKRLFELFCNRAAEAGIGHSWSGVDGDPGHLFAAAARVVDLTLTPQSPIGGFEALAPQVGEQLIMDAGGPVLMLPPGRSHSSIGGAVLLGWNGSREAARALRDAMPFFREADAVYVLAIGESEAASLGHVVDNLKRHDLEVIGRTAERGDLSPGERLLQQAEELDVDLLVMGAYGHSRLREIVLGGATRHVLQSASIPVLFSN